MDHQTLIERFSEIVNAGLAAGEDRSAQATAQLAPQLDALDDVERAACAAMLRELQDHFAAAYQPSHFVTRRIMQPGSELDQCYALLAQALGVDVLESKATFEALLKDINDTSHFTLIGRFWVATGTHRYDATGRLIQFGYDPLTVTQGIAATIAGDYVRLNETPGVAMGAVGQAAARIALRGTGHGKQVYEAFETTMQKIADSQGETLRLMLLESEGPARQFWASRGYRWPQGVRYQQPPIDYDRTTGEPLFDAVTELLMVKLLDEANATQIERALLMDAVRSLYHAWYIPDDVPEVAHVRIKAHVIGDIFGDFVASLPAGDAVPLVQPPSV